MINRSLKHTICLLIWENQRILFLQWSLQLISLKNSTPSTLSIIASTILNQWKLLLTLPRLTGKSKIQRNLWTSWRRKSKLSPLEINLNIQLSLKLFILWVSPILIWANIHTQSNVLKKVSTCFDKFWAKNNLISTITGTKSNCRWEGH